MLDRGQMHRAALAAHQADVAQHQLAEHALHRGAASERVRVAAVGAERLVALAHRDAEARRDRLLAERQMARALDHVLQEEIERALLAIANFDLEAEQLQTAVEADVVVSKPVARRSHLYGGHIGRFPPNVVAAELARERLPRVRKNSPNARFRARPSARRRDFRQSGSAGEFSFWTNRPAVAGLRCRRLASPQADYVRSRAAKSDGRRRSSSRRHRSPSSDRRLATRRMEASPSRHALTGRRRRHECRIRTSGRLRPSPRWRLQAVVHRREASDSLPKCSHRVDAALTRRVEGRKQ